jgi:uncharacterized membrane protein
LTKARIPDSSRHSMAKNRLEFLSDGVFAIVMTLLVIEIHVPALEVFSERALLNGLGYLLPLFLSYFLSFALLTSYWNSHNFLFSIMAKNVTRTLAYLNLLLLSFISLVPFSSAMLGAYPQSQVAISVYSLHILILALLLYIIREYISRAKSVENPEDLSTRFSSRDRLYGTARILIAVGCSVAALLVSFFNTHISIVLLIIPVILGAVPGLLGLLFRVTGLEKLARDVDKGKII